MSIELIENHLNPRDAITLKALKRHADSLLDITPRFKYFTLHGRVHLDSLFRILSLLLDAGLKLTERELYLLSLAICTHDLGMVVSLKDFDFSGVAEGRPGFSDPVGFENFVRETHHDLITEYMSRDLNLLTGLGITVPDITTANAIGRAHRRVNLDTLSGLEQKLGALLRVIDELDVGPNRAPAAVFENIIDELDNVSCWHWFKHNITLDWDIGHNVNIVEENRRKSIEFSLVVRPPNAQSIKYWLTQVYRPIRKALIDEGAGLIIERAFGITIKANREEDQSRSSGLKTWERYEQRALSQGRKVILVVDDEVSKYDDLFYPLMDKFQILKAPNARAALTALEATDVTMAVVDLQMGSGGLWTDLETSDFKLTGIELSRRINKDFPKVKVGILTGTKHRLPDLSSLELAFFLRKPVMPEDLMNEIVAKLDDK